MALNPLALTGVCKASVCYLDQVDTRQVVVKVLLIGKTTFTPLSQVLTFIWGLMDIYMIPHT